LVIVVGRTPRTGRSRGGWFSVVAALAVDAHCCAVAAAILRVTVGALCGHGSVLTTSVVGVLAVAVRDTTPATPLVAVAATAVFGAIAAAVLVAAVILVSSRPVVTVAGRVSVLGAVGLANLHLRV